MKNLFLLCVSLLFSSQVLAITIDKGTYTICTYFHLEKSTAQIIFNVGSFSRTSITLTGPVAENLLIKSSNEPLDLTFALNNVHNGNESPNAVLREFKNCKKGQSPVVNVGSNLVPLN